MRFEDIKKGNTFTAVNTSTGMWMRCKKVSDDTHRLYRFHDHEGFCLGGYRICLESFLENHEIIN